MLRVPISRAMPAILLGSLVLAPEAHADDVVRRAMNDELKRSIDQLQLEQSDKPYFVSYSVEDVATLRVAAGFGSLLASEESSQRWLRVEVRVGDYALDDTNFDSDMGFPVFLREEFSRSRLPIEDDYREIRRQIWLATDWAYKQAIETLAKKRAVLQNRTRSDDLPDFSHEPPTTVEDAAPTTTLVRAEVEALVRDLSAQFRKMPEIQSSDVDFRSSVVRTRYVNSEGSSFDRNAPSIALTAKATTQAAEGQPLEDFVAFHARRMSDLPPDRELAASIDRMGARLASLRQASSLELYNGPVLFEDQAAAELLAQVLVPALRANREPLREDASRPATRRGASLGDKIGALVLPRSLSVTDDPTRSEFAENLLAASYKVDDEGVAARPTRLIEHGILKTLLADRSPVVGVAHSTGNRRGGSIMPSNVIVTADQAMSRQQLGQEMQGLVRERGNEFGVVVRRIGNPYYKQRDERTFVFAQPIPGESRVEESIEAYKVYADGREELIRNVRFSGISPASFKDIVAVSGEAVVYTAPSQPDVRTPFPMFGFTRPPQVVSYVVPSLLFAEMTLKRSSDEAPRPPILPHPYFARDAGK